MAPCLEDIKTDESSLRADVGMPDFGEERDLFVKKKFKCMHIHRRNPKITGTFKANGILTI
jgi:hypothetical protein